MSYRRMCMSESCGAWMGWPPPGPDDPVRQSCNAAAPASQHPYEWDPVTQTWALVYPNWLRDIPRPPSPRGQ